MYTVGKKHKEKYPIYNEEGRIIAECLNTEDTEDIVQALNIRKTLKEFLNLNSKLLK